MNVKELAERLPPIDSLSPVSMGKLFYAAFETNIPPQLRYLLKNGSVNSISNGNPVLYLTHDGNFPVIWREHGHFEGRVPAKTRGQTPYSPRVNPYLVDSAPTILTVAKLDNSRQDGMDEQSLLIAKTESGEIQTYVFHKNDYPAKPDPLFSLHAIQPLLTYEPPKYTRGALIQLWKLGEDDVRNRFTYMLKANLETHDISLDTFLRVMAADPETLKN